MGKSRGRASATKQSSPGSSYWVPAAGIAAASACIALALFHFQRLDELTVEKRRPPLPKDCTDQFGGQCPAMAAQGHCTSSPGWMSVNCAAACDMCEMSKASVRCALTRYNRTAALPEGPDALDVLFERILAEHAELAPRVLSRPPAGPWIVTLDDFVTAAEIDGLMRESSKSLARSTDVGATDATTGVTAKVVSKKRTSSNSWCLSTCEKSLAALSLTAKIERLLGVSRAHFEQFQVLRYEPGEEYQRHHDYVPRKGVPEPAGPRLLTVFLYFSDVESGGETAFTDLVPPIAVAPKRGRALLWPSVLSDDFMRQDVRTHHQARPVLAGTKYAANAWVHVHEFRKPNLWGCTGNFE